jgi:AcrR family transcriptional regulator
MNSLAVELNVSRATLYRWVRSREDLLSAVLDQLSGEFVAQARHEAKGTGDDRVLDFARRLMKSTVSYEPIRVFVSREPELALRLLLAHGGVVHRAAAQGLSQVLGETRSPEEAEALSGFIDAVVQIGTALQWATFAIGDEPQIERAVEVARIVLQSGQATNLTPSDPAPSGPRTVGAPSGPQRSGRSRG